MMQVLPREVGRRIPQKGAKQRVRGEARFTHDISLPGMLTAAVLRSPHAHARILEIDTSAARALPGIHAVITAADFPGRRYQQLGGSYADRFPLAVDVVRFQGEEVAAVAADSMELAQQALRLIRVSYEPLPALLTPEAALAEDAPALHEAANMAGGRNLAIRFRCDYGAIDQAFAEAAHVFEDEFSHGVVVPACMETNATVASFEANSGDLTLWTATQAPYFIRKEVAHVLGLEVERVHIRGVEVGGGFGGKSKICEQEALAARLSVATGRPVRLLLDRREEFISGKTDHAKRIRIRTAVAADGTILGRSTSLQIDNGAYTAYAPTYVGASRQRTTCLYRVKTAHYDCDLVYTNKVPGGQYRGMGAPQTIWAIESHMDQIAERLGRDPLEYRLAQANRSGDVTPLGWKISSCGLSDCLAEVARRIGWDEKRKTSGLHDGKYRGVGIAAMIHPSGGVIYQEGNYANSRVELLRNGEFVVHTQTADAGTWQNTTLAQLAAEGLGVPSELVRVSHMDTDAAPPDLGSAASRVAFVSGNATLRAGQALQRKIAEQLGRHWNCNPDDLSFADGRVTLADPMRSASIAEVAALCAPLDAEARYSTPGERPDPATGIGNYAATYVFGAQAVEVEVDPATGKVTILKIVAAQDVGRALNPTAMEGQIYGGIVQGIGMALQEELIFEEGRPVNASFLDYKVPRIGDSAPIEIALIETNDPEGPLGAKAGAEPTINATIAAIANAVAHATGIRFKQLPMSPDRVLPQLVEKEGRTLALKPWKRPYNLEVATVRAAYPDAVFPVLRKVGTKFAKLPKTGVKPDVMTPRDVDGLLAALSQPGRKARILGGGTDLFVGLRQGIYDTDLLVDASRLAALRGITQADDVLLIGAATPLAEITGSGLVHELLPMLAEGVELIATPQIRSVATVAGDLCQEKRCWFFRSAFPCYKLGGTTCPCFAVQGNSRFHSILGAKRCAAPCPADLAPIFTALDATAVILGPRGERRVKMADFYHWSGLSCVAADEAILRFELPLPRGTSHAFEKFAVRRSDFAEASVAVRLGWDGGHLNDVRISLGAVAPLPIRATATERALLAAGKPNAAAIRQAAELAVHGSLPLRDNTHKTHLLVNLTERAITSAIAARA
ncbi:molybdopterin cofactor-binding domain-containing protein [Ferrovibrio sp. MS7]|uniref:molybdopterin cofactor-binding domain-containing protein n=1 Tax=Ferrovibrio plantarum TaxID=3119164 RepID=UPI00313593B1